MGRILTPWVVVLDEDPGGDYTELKLYRAGGRWLLNIEESRDFGNETELVMLTAYDLVHDWPQLVQALRDDLTKLEQYPGLYPTHEVARVKEWLYGPTLNKGNDEGDDDEQD